jgi:hypothetical protein
VVAKDANKEDEMVQHLTDGRARPAQRELEEKLTQLEKASAKERTSREKVLETLLGSADLLSWVAPCDDVVGEDILAEHFLQIRNAVRLVLCLAVDEDHGAAVNLNAASTASRLVQTNIALARALGVTAGANSKTVRGGRRGKGPQD